MTTRLDGLAPGDALGYPATYRATLGKAGYTFGDSMFDGGISDVQDTLHGSDLAVPVNTDAPLPGADVFVQDVRVVDVIAGTRSVSDLVQLLNGADWRIDLVALERIPSSDAYNGPGSSSRAATTTTAQAQATAASVWTRALHAVLVVAVLLVALVAFLGVREVEKWT